MANLPERLDPRELRASDAARERVGDALRTAVAEGRLTLDELDERLSAVYAAKTYADLEPIVRDLPGTVLPPVPRTAGAAEPTGMPPSRMGIAILGGFERKGPWVVADTFNAVGFFGGGKLDLREARFTHGEVTIWAFAVMGGITVVVPEDAEVHVNGVGIMGGFDHRASGAGAPGAPRVVVNGFAFWGGVDVKRRPPEDEIKRRKAERKAERQAERQRRKLERG